MGASYANAPDGAATGASSFYTLVVLTLYLAAVVPILFTRLAKGNKNVTTVALAISCAGSFVAFKRVHPAAVAWADASSVFDPYDILQIPSTANATVVKKAYRSLSRTAHPDKGGDAETFRKIQNAHAALAGDVTARRNYRDFGHPDGPRPSFAGFALPHGFEATAVGLYVLMLVLVLLPVLRLATGGSSAPNALPKKATVLALRDALQENAPAHISTWLLLLGKLLDEVEGVDASEVSENEKAAVAHGAGSASCAFVSEPRRRRRAHGVTTQSRKTSTRTPASPSSRPSRASRRRARCSSSAPPAVESWTRTAIPGRSTSPRLWPARPSSSRAARGSPSRTCRRPSARCSASARPRNAVLQAYSRSNSRSTTTTRRCPTCGRLI